MTITLYMPDQIQPHKLCGCPASVYIGSGQTSCVTDAVTLKSKKETVTMSENLNNATVVTVPDFETYTGFQCFDYADSLPLDGGASIYASGAVKVVTQHAVDTDAMQTAIASDIDARYPVADCPDKSDNQKRFTSVKRAYQRAGKKAFSVPATDDTPETFDGELKITFNVSGSKKKDSTEKRTRSVTVELITATQQVANQKMADLKEEQKKEVDALKEEQKTAILADTPAGEIFDDVKKYMLEKYGNTHERAVVSLWLSSLDNTVIDDVQDSDSDSDSGLSQDSIDKLTGTNS
jgi:hypothetical protein